MEIVSAEKGFTCYEQGFLVNLSPTARGLPSASLEMAEPDF